METLHCCIYCSLTQVENHCGLHETHAQPYYAGYFNYTWKPDQDEVVTCTCSLLWVYVGGQRHCRLTRNPLSDLHHHPHRHHWPHHINKHHHQHRYHFQKGHHCVSIRYHQRRCFLKSDSSETGKNVSSWKTLSLSFKSNTHVFLALHFIVKPAKTFDNDLTSIGPKIRISLKATEK